ncbi:MAG TPA: hypothetical protein VFA78_04030 [Chloroflexota bacterium]|nr:hypothetical protein [Chloroflexota bacterium]
MARREEQELSEDTVDRITRGIRSLSDDRVDRGVELDRPMRCDACGLEKPGDGAARYGAYQLCNDCLLDFTLRLARGSVANVVDYMRRPDSGEPVTELTEPRERSRAVNSLPTRDRLVPGNEPC